MRDGVKAEAAPLDEREPARLEPAAAVGPSGILALQRTAGNAAVTSMLRRRTLARDPKAPPDTVARPALSELETIATMNIANYYSAASGAVEDFQNTGGDEPDWAAFWINIAGNVLWATACFVNPAAGFAATAGKQFAVSLAGIAASALATRPRTKEQFRKAAIDKHVSAINTQLLGQVKAVSASVDADAARGNWGDNRTRMELARRMVKPEYVTEFAGGFPSVDATKIRRGVLADLLIEANELGNTENPQFGLYSTGRVEYHYNLYGALDDSGWVNTVESTGNWRFYLQKVKVWLPTGRSAGVAALAEAGTLHPSQMKMMKTIHLTAEGQRFHMQDNTWEIQLDEKNQLYSTTWRDGIFLAMDDPDEWADHALKRMWSATSGLPPDVDKFEAGSK